MKRHDEKVNVQSWSRRFTDSPDRVRVQVLLNINTTRSCTSTSTSHHRALDRGSLLVVQPVKKNTPWGFLYFDPFPRVNSVSNLTPK